MRRKRALGPQMWTARGRRKTRWGPIKVFGNYRHTGMVLMMTRMVWGFLKRVGAIILAERREWLGGDGEM
jgi:hypothetical protein